MSENWITLTPAYGRDYKTGAEVLKHWSEGKDFRIADISSRWNGSYCSVRDFSNGEVDVVKIRFLKLTEFALLKKVNGEWVLTPDLEREERELGRQLQEGKITSVEHAERLAAAQSAAEQDEIE